MEPENKNTWEKFHRLKPKTKHLSRRARRLELATVRHAHKFLIHRWQNVREVRRHMLSWLLLVAILIGATGLQILWSQGLYMLDAQDTGGTYAEGAVGPLETLNPLYATTAAERSASRLVFAGLLSYDTRGQLRGDLARSWRVIDGGKKYVVSLRDGLTWHDGAPFTSSDVVFTIDMIKNDETRSPLSSSWQSINVKALNSRTVQFSLPSAYAPFPHALTVGILPEHILRDVAPASLRENDFGMKPVGTGPFVFRSIQTLTAEQGRKVIHLKAFDHYVHGAPKLERFQLHTYETTDRLRRALAMNEVSAASGLTVGDMAAIDKNRFRLIDAPINNGTYALFKTNGGILRDAGVRRAIRLGTNTTELRQKLGNRVGALTGPILANQVGGREKLPGVKFNYDKARQELNKLGWRKGSDGIRTKKGQQLRLSIVSIKSGDYPLVVDTITKQWEKLGIKVEAELVESDDVQQSVLRPRAFDVLIYELSLGADPDVYAYWHSSQASQNGLNFANYSSPIADNALESARSRLEPRLRNEKYLTFVQQWLKDAPAVPLYQPSLHYATVQTVRSVPENATIIDDVDRYRMVEYWTAVRTRLYETP
jgi:peptide/nickel transport system substrate-binding protein